MISVVVPNLNEEKHLPAFLSSLASQSFKDFELIIVDGVSTDRSLGIIHAYRKKLKIRLVFCRVRNFGFIRNLGNRYARGNVVLQSNSDCYFPPSFMERLAEYYHVHPSTLAITGRVHPMGTSFIAKLAYPAFDLVRFLTASLPSSVQKFRPSGSFVSYRAHVFMDVGGFPEVTTNEDGLFGQRIDELCRRRGRKSVVYLLNLYVGHHVKKFEQWGGVKALLFYLYVLGNHFPMLKPFLRSVEDHAGDVFSGKTVQR